MIPRPAAELAATTDAVDFSGSFTLADSTGEMLTGDVRKGKLFTGIRLSQNGVEIYKYGKLVKPRRFFPVTKQWRMYQRRYARGGKR